MAYWPDWNSPDSMHAWKVGLYVAGVVALLVSLALGAIGELVFGRGEAKLQKSETRKLQNEVRTNKEDNAKLRGENQQLRQDVFREKERGDRLEEQQKWRAVTKQQAEVLARNLSALQGFPITFTSATNDPEARDYATRLVNAFQVAGVNATLSGPISRVIVGGPAEIEPKGVVLRMKDPNNMPNHMVLISKALKAAAIAHTYEPLRPALGEEIFVGSKPPPN